MTTVPFNGQPQQRVVEIPQYPPEVVNEAVRLLGWSLSAQSLQPGLIDSSGAPVACKRTASGLIQRADEDVVRTWLVVCQLIVQIAYLNGVLMQQAAQNRWLVQNFGKDSEIAKLLTGNPTGDPEERDAFVSEAHRLLAELTENIRRAQEHLSA